MPEDYYPESKADSPPPGKSESEEPEQKTTLVPKDMFGGKEPIVDEEYLFKVVHLYDKEVELAYATGKEKKSKSTMDDADEKMDSMAEENSNPGNPGPGY